MPEVLVLTKPKFGSFSFLLFFYINYACHTSSGTCAHDPKAFILKTGLEGPGQNQSWFETCWWCICAEGLQSQLTINQVYLRSNNNDHPGLSQYPGSRTGSEDKIGGASNGSIEIKTLFIGEFHGRPRGTSRFFRELELPSPEAPTSSSWIGLCLRLSLALGE